MESGRIVSIASFKDCAKEPWCAVAFLYLTFVGGAAVNKYLVDGAPVTDIVHWLWVTATSFATRPLVQLAMIPLALWMFGHGIRRIERRRQADVEAQEARITREAVLQENWTARIEAALSDLAKIPVELGKLGLFAKELDAFEGSIVRLTDWASKYADWASLWLCNEPWAVDSQDALYNHTPDEFHFGPFYSFQPPDWDHQAWKVVLLNIPTTGEFLHKVRTYDPSDNAPARDALQINLSALKTRIVELRQFKEVQVENLQQRHRELEERIKRYGA